MGGAGGHMAHPYDLDWVKSGKDLLRFYELAKDLKGTVKIDGANVSFKLVGDDSNKEFAVDRGSMSNLDIEGVTVDRVKERFRPPHGMIRMSTILLSILNETLPEITEELKEFGMYDDPSRFLNTEFVEAKPLNVTQYDKNFLAIHGLSQFYERTAKSGASKGNYRPGLSVPEDPMTGKPMKKPPPSTEIPYNKATMDSMVAKIDKNARAYGFEVINEAPIESKGELADYSSALAAPLTIKLTDDKEITKPLSEWLQSVENPGHVPFRLKDGKTIGALSRQNYLNLVENGLAVYDLMEEDAASAAISGAVIVHANRLLGNNLLDAYTSVLGDLRDQEGIVLRNAEKFDTDRPVKITGDFIIKNLGGGFGVVSEGIQFDDEGSIPPEYKDQIVAMVKSRNLEQIAHARELAAMFDSPLDLSDVDLSKTNLYYTDLSDVILSGANLSNTNLGGVSLRNANLTGANLSGSYLLGADLAGAILDDIIYDDDTIFPNGFTPPPSASVLSENIEIDFDDEDEDMEDDREEIEVIDDSPNIENIIMIYPGRFQPMGKHHAGVYKELAKRFGEENTFIATTNKVALPKSPLNFVEKLKVINKHGIKNVVNVKNPYKAEEITKRFDPETTAVLFAVGDKDMRDDPRFRIGFKKNGQPSYFQKYSENEGNLKPYTEHGYLYVAPHISLDVPGYGEMSGTTLRRALANASKEDFQNIMDFFDPDIYEMLKEKFGNLQEMSSMAGGAVAGYSGPLGSTSAKRDDEEEDLVNEVLNYLLKQGFIK